MENRTPKGEAPQADVRPGRRVPWPAAAGKGIVYLTLITGAIVFSFPFVWMAATSVKVDRELQTRDLRILPLTPHPHARSPYIDTELYRDLEGPHQPELLAALEERVELLTYAGVAIPGDVNREIAKRQIARGLYSRIRSRLPASIWDADVNQLIAAAQREATADLANEVLATVYRRFTISAIRLRSYDLKEVQLGAEEGAPALITQQLENHTPSTAVLLDLPAEAKPTALVRYDFTNGRRITLTGTCTVPDDFDLKQLHRVQMEIRPDDTWHELMLSIEFNGEHYRAARPFLLGNYQVVTAAWQPPGPDDTSLKLKSWIRLEKLDEPSPVTRPGEVKVTLEVTRTSQAGAWWNKIRNNYTRVLDHIPFWRYVRVSMFLVIVKVLLAMFFSSLVAYAFARLNWPGREFCFILALATMMIPFQVIMIPQFLIWKNLGAYNTLTPLWIGPAFGNAFFIFLLRQSLKGIPRDLEDAARIDGCGFLGIYWHIMLPLIKPTLAAIAIFTFMGTWNDFMGPLIYLADQRLYPLAFGLYAYSVQVGNDPALTMAASLLMTVPVIIIFFLAQKYFIQGITLTGMKQ